MSSTANSCHQRKDASSRPIVTRWFDLCDSNQSRASTLPAFGTLPYLQSP